MSAVTHKRVLHETPGPVALMAAGVVASASVGLGFGYLLLGGLSATGDVVWPPYLLLLPLLGVGSYAVVFGTTVVCNAAVIATAFERLAGRPATAAEGFRRALTRLPALLWWSTVSLVVGVAIQVGADRTTFAGPAIRWSLALAWAVGTFSVVPVIVVERAWVGSGVRRSALRVRRHWREAASGTLSPRAFAFAIVLLSAAAVGMLARWAFISAAWLGYWVLRDMWRLRNAELRTKGQRR